MENIFIYTNLNMRPITHHPMLFHYFGTLKVINLICNPIELIEIPLLK